MSQNEGNEVAVDVVVDIPHQPYEIICTTFGTITCILALILAFYHIAFIHKYKGLRFDTKAFPTLILSYFVVFTAAIFNVNLCIYSFDLPSVVMCYYGKFGGVPLYCAFKLLIYCIIVIRLYVIFKEFKEYSYSALKLKVWCIFLSIWCAVNIFLIVSLTDIVYNPANHPVCYILPAQIALGSIGLLDFVAGGINAYLFIQSVIHLRGKQNKSKKEEKLKHAAIKQCVISIIAIVTTIIAMFGIAIFSMPQVFAGTDVVITALCVIFMYDWNDYILYKLGCCACCLMSSSVHIKQTANVQMTSEMNDNPQV